MAQRRVIAIVDDDALIRETLKDLLDSAGYTSVVFTSAQGLLNSKRLATFACLITDMRMPGTTGFELHQRLVSAGHAIPTILITAYPDETVRARALGAGILCYLPKPVTSDALLACVDEALETRRGQGSGQDETRCAGGRHTPARGGGYGARHD
jgi:FixJ family two-component response regulator